MVFGISYGELFLILGATAALIGPKDLPIIARTAGRLAGRAIGYVQLARGQLETVLQQSQANKVHKELQDMIAQLEAIRYEIRSISIMNPGPFTRRLDGEGPAQNNEIPPGNDIAAKPEGDHKPAMTILKDINSSTVSSSLQSQAAVYARIAESAAIKTASSASSGHAEKVNADDGHLTILPVSAESTGLLPQHSGKDEARGSDIMLEAILEAEVACKAKHFFSQSQNQLPNDETVIPPVFSPYVEVSQPIDGMKLDENKLKGASIYMKAQAYQA